MGRVLVVDDDHDICELVKTWLIRGGHMVAVANSAEQAKTVITDKGVPDVAVVDVAMPGMSGFDLVSEMRNDPELAEVPVIFLSAKVLPEDIEEGLKLGALYLTKPFVGSALLSAVEDLLTTAVAGGGDW